jgi:insertion element IS1 protein InsB
MEASLCNAPCVVIRKPINLARCPTVISVLSVLPAIKGKRRRTLVICLKKQKQCLAQELEVGDCWIGLSLADSSGLILVARVGKNTDVLIEELGMSPEGKTDCKRFNSDNWGGYEGILPPEIQHYIGKDKTQRLERTHGIVRQQTGRWHRRQNKFGKVWKPTKVTTR